MSVNEVKLKRAEVAFQIRGTGHPGSRTFALGDEDHTIGNALRHVLINDPSVDFAGYCVPHPSEPVVHIRVQTARPRPRQGDGDVAMEGADDGDGQLTAVEALKDACASLTEQCDAVLLKLEEVMPEVKEDRERMERLAQADLEFEDEAEEEMQEGEEDFQ